LNPWVKGEVFRDFEVFEQIFRQDCPYLGVPILVCWAGYVGFKLGGMSNLVQKKIRVV